MPNVALHIPFRVALYLIASKQYLKFVQMNLKTHLNELKATENHVKQEVGRHSEIVIKTMIWQYISGESGKCSIKPTGYHNEVSPSRSFIKIPVATSAPSCCSTTLALCGMFKYYKLFFHLRIYPVLIFPCGRDPFLCEEGAVNYKKTTYYLVQIPSILPVSLVLIDSLPGSNIPLILYHEKGYNIYTMYRIHTNLLGWCVDIILCIPSH